MFKKMTALLLTGTLLMGQMTFAAELSKLEYTKQLVKGLGFEVKSAEEAYNRKTSESEDIIYTAFQMGLLKGVSWDFENPMTEEEREVILGNAMGIHAENKESSDEANSYVADQEENEADQKAEASKEDTSNSETAEYDFSTPYGEIKKPTDINVNDNIWTDEEFHNLLIENPRMFKRSKIARSNEDAKTAEYWGDQWYYNIDTKHIMVRDDVIGKHDDGEDLYNYVDLDEVTNGRGVTIMKALLYHAQKHNMNLQFMPQPDSEQLRIRISEKDHGGGNIIFLISYGPEKRERRYSQIEGYDSSVNPVETEWMIDRLWDWSIYSDRGLDDDDFTPEEHKDFIQSHSFADKKYTDFVYGICDYIYKDGMDVYRAMMTAHIQEKYEKFNDIEDEYDFRMVETDHQEVYIFDQKIHSDIYGITLGK
ncbi:hypothetical protein [Fusibacter sp. JL216-2]|uniref:hypothetical protein n=1 Tax=Fusibacter sp. JL216-2 TaxID=3071453 RepID=UPI003D32D2C0